MGVTRSLQVTTKPVQDGMAESYFEVYCTVFKTAVEESQQKPSVIEAKRRPTSYSEMYCTVFKTVVQESISNHQ